MRARGSKKERTERAPELEIKTKKREREREREGEKERKREKEREREREGKGMTREREQHAVPERIRGDVDSDLCTRLSSCLSGRVYPSYRSLSGRLMFTVRRHMFNQDSPSHQALSL